MDVNEIKKSVLVCENHLKHIRQLLDEEYKNPSIKEPEARTGPCQYGKAYLKKGAKRPEVAVLRAAIRGYDLASLTSGGYTYTEEMEKKVEALQKENGLKVDGVVGPNTWKAISKVIRPSNVSIHLKSFILSTYIELGGHQDAFGFREPDIGDGAGSNFGTLQFNNRGSLKTVTEASPAGKDVYTKYMSNPDKYRDLMGDWMGSEEGIMAQVNYYKNMVSSKVMPELEQLPYMLDDPAGATLALMIDLRIQNGTVFSPYRRPQQADLKGRWDKRFGRVIPWRCVQYLLSATSGSIREANRQVLREVLGRIMEDTGNYREGRAALAMYRARCSRKRYVERVEARKLLFADGEAEIHGQTFKLYDEFGITF